MEDDGFVPFGEELVFGDEYARDDYDQYDEEEKEADDYGDDIEEKDIDLGGEDLIQDDMRPERDDMEQFGGDVFQSSYYDRERVGGPISSVAQIKSLINIFGSSLGRKEDKLSFANLSDEDIFKLLLNNAVYSNKLNNYYPSTNFTALMETMFPLLEKVPNLKYKNPSALFISFLCVSRKGKLLSAELSKWKMAIKALNIYCTDVIRYSRLWKIIYK